MENTNGLNVVLVHGGFVDGSGWEDVHNILTRDGHHVAVVQIRRCRWPTTSSPRGALLTRRTAQSSWWATPMAEQLSPKPAMTRRLRDWSISRHSLHTKVS